MKIIKPFLIGLSFILLTASISCGSTNTAQGASTGAVVGGLVGGWEGMATKWS